MRPDGFSDEDEAKAGAYHNRADVVIWTPGVSSGNPVLLNLRPDFGGIGRKQDKQADDERAQAVEMARATLAPYLGGAGQRGFLKQGVLAQNSRTLEAVIAAIGQLLRTYTTQQCANYFKNAGYGLT